MDDLIKRADAIAYIDKVINSGLGRNKSLDYIHKYISALPSADAVHGEWIKKQVFNPELDKYVPLIECSVCGYEPYFGGSESKFNYCANCGARMKGGGTE